MSEIKESPVSPDTPEAKVPVLRSLSELEQRVVGETHRNLFLRWTPNLQADRKQGAVSRNLGFGTQEAGISVHPLNPYPENGYGLDQRYRMEGNSQRERKYYLLKGNQVVDADGKPVLGDDREPLLIPESIVPIAEITPEAIEEANYRRLAFGAIKDDKFTEPGEMMGEIKAIIAEWSPVRESSERLRQRTLAGIDRYLELHQSA
jgi:hypothetical protein